MKNLQRRIKVENTCIKQEQRFFVLRDCKISDNLKKTISNRMHSMKNSF